MTVHPTLLERIKTGKRTDFVITIDEALHYDGTLVVPNNLELKCEAHDT